MNFGKSYKVLAPIKGEDGKTHWATVGRGHTNKDQSINFYLTTLPVTVFGGGELKLQLREYDEEDLKRRDEYRHRRDDGAGLSGPTAVPF